MRKYDFVVVGAGLYGAVIAHELHKVNCSVLVVEKRDHIAGNCYDYYEEDLLVSKYGPHTFHCADQSTWDYVNQFAKFTNVVPKPKVIFESTIYSFPINLFTFQQLWGVNSPSEAQKILESKRYKIECPKNFKEFVLSEVGEEIYHIFFEGYTKKQWGCDPSELPASIAKRIPIRLTFDDNYYHSSQLFQGLPRRGYTAMVANMLANIAVELNTDFIDNQEYFKQLAHKIVYTGPLDVLYKYQFGQLDYRSLRFENEWHQGDYQGCAQINYTDAETPWTRIIEWKHVGENNSQRDKTLITKEFPCNFEETGEAYYPIRNEKNIELHRKYLGLAQQDGLIVGGRSADYLYYDMNMAIAAARKTVQEIINSNLKK